MSSSSPPCDQHAESISLLAAACLSKSEEQALREHFEICPACLARFLELHSLSSQLPIARPAIPVALSNLANPSYLVELPRTTRTAASFTRDPRRRVDRLRVMLLVSTLLFVALWLTHDFQPRRRPVSHSAAPTVASSAPSPVPRDSDPPTLLALHRAAAESDESLNRLLARYSQPQPSEPLRPYSLWKDQLQ
jgi:hypothetical protein